MKKTNLILFAILAVLGSTVAWYFTTKEDTSLEGYDFHLAIQDTANIGKIFIADRQGKTATLKRVNKNEWTINDKYSANANAVSNLLETVNRVELMYRLPRNAVKPVVQDLASNSIKVEIYAKNGDKLRTFYSGNVDMNGDGTYMMLEGSNEPYAMHIPQFRGALTARFFTEEMDWRDKFIFKLAVEDIKSVSIEYPLQKSKSFKVIKNGASFTVEPFYSITPRINRPPVTGLVETFLTSFHALGAEGFETQYAYKDSVRQVTPFAILTVVDKNDNVKKLTLHPIVPKESDGTPRVDPNGQVNIEHYFADDSSGDFFMVQHFVFEKIFWAYEGFFGKPIKN